LSLTTTTINNDNAVLLKNVHVEWAKAIHRDNGKGKREKKECRGSGIGVGNNDNVPGFASG
jgi:hypothetical protein